MWVLSSWRIRRKNRVPMSHSSPPGARRGIGPSVLVRLLLSRRLGIRYATLLSLGIATFVVCQAIAYWWLPEALLRGRSGGVLVGGEEAADNFWVEWSRIVGFNMVVLFLCTWQRISSGSPTVCRSATSQSS